MAGCRRARCLHCSEARPATPHCHPAAERRSRQPSSSLRSSPCRRFRASGDRPEDPVRSPRVATDHGRRPNEPISERRDIYHLVFDRYGSERSLALGPGIDNSEFVGWLRERGFQVVDDARANFERTVLSLSAIHDMSLHEDLANRSGRVTTTRRSHPHEPRRLDAQGSGLRLHPGRLVVGTKRILGPRGPDHRAKVRDVLRVRASGPLAPAQLRGHSRHSATSGSVDGSEQPGRRDDRGPVPVYRLADRATRPEARVRALPCAA